MSETWATFDVLEDLPSAEVIAGRLRVGEVPARIQPDTPVPGLNEGYRVLVPARLAHRARWLLASEDMTDSELNYLATGKLEAPGPKSEAHGGNTSTRKWSRLTVTCCLVVAIALIWLAWAWPRIQGW